MSWVTVIWSMLVSACLTLAGMYFLVWCRNRSAWANLLFALSAVGTAGLGTAELLIMRATSLEQHAILFRWGHVPVWVLVLSMAGFVRLHMRAGRAWLMWTVCGLRTLHLLVNFLVGQNAIYLEQGPVRHIRFLGETVAVGRGVPSPLGALVGLLSLATLIVYTLDAAVTVWRRGDRRMALSVGGGIIFVSMIGLLQTATLNWQSVHMPLTVSLFFVGVLFAMGYEMSRDTSRASQLAEELAENQAQMNLAAKAAGVGVWVWDTARNRVWGSEQWATTFGAGPDAPGTIEAVLHRIHPGDREMVEREIRRAVKDGSEYRADHRVILPDGSHHWMASRGAMQPASDGTPARMLSATIDITARKGMELKLAASERRYRTLVEAAPEGIAVIGADGCIRSANLAQALLYGYESPEQIRGLYAPLCLAERDRHRAQQTMRRLLDGEEQPPRQYAALRRDGSEFMVEVTSAVLREADGRLEGYLCLTRDITENRRTETALRESERRFRQVAELAGEFIWEVDANGLYMYASPSVERLLGYTPEELVGKKRFYDLFAPSVREDLTADAIRIITDRARFQDFPNPNVSKSGQVLYLETNGSPIVDAEGKLVGYRGVDTDVTARTMAQAEIADQRNELVHLSRVTMLGELAGSLAHELNQPLTAILSNAQAAQRFLADGDANLDEVRDILKDIATDDQRAGEIIRRLRLLLRKGEVQHGPLDINDVVQDVLRLVRNDLMNHGVWLRTEFTSGLPVVKGDRVQLQQVLLNLIMNAVDAMAQVSPGEKKQLFVSTQRSTEEEVCIAVTDHGIGLGADVLEKIFSPYFTTKTGGMGMGLTVCRTIITAHGGCLRGRNNPQRGATFEFTLPASREEQP